MFLNPDGLSQAEYPPAIQDSSFTIHDTDFQHHFAQSHEAHDSHCLRLRLLSLASSPFTCDYIYLGTYQSTTESTAYLSTWPGNPQIMANARHPLQRLASPSPSFSALVHLLGIISFSLSFRWLFMYPNPEADKYGGSFQFLTIIGLALALTSMVLGLLADLTSSRTLFHAKNIVSVCSTPLEVLVSILYWGISLIDKRLLFPEELQLPFLPDFGFHAMPAIMLTLDLLLFSPPWAIKFPGAIGLSTALAFAYWAWIEYCFSYNQTYVRLLPKEPVVALGM